MKASFDPSWEKKMYSQNKQVMRYPAGDLVTFVLRLYGAALKEGRKLRALELGCGTGNNLAFLAKEGFEAFGVEGSASACAAAAKFLKAQSVSARIENADFIRLPYPDAHFDLIVDREAVCHNKKAAVSEIAREVRRCLKPGGRFLSFAFSREDGRIEADGGKELEPGTYTDFKKGNFEGAGTTHFFTEAEVRAELMAGLELEFLFHHRNDFLHPEKRNQYAEFIACGRKGA